MPQSSSVLKAVSVGEMVTNAGPLVEMKSLAMIDPSVPSKDEARSQ